MFVVFKVRHPEQKLTPAVLCLCDKGKPEHHSSVTGTYYMKDEELWIFSCVE
jgi:hypothetical protein